MVTADELRPKWGLLAEWEAHLQNMTEQEYRGFQVERERDRKTWLRNLDEYTKEHAIKLSFRFDEWLGAI